MTSIWDKEPGLSAREIASRFDHIRFALNSLQQRSGKNETNELQPDWEFASRVYLNAVGQSAPPLDETSLKAQRFMQAMYELATSGGENLDLAFEWKHRFKQETEIASVVWTDIEQSIAAHLDNLKGRIRRFLSGPLIKPWEPSAAWKNVLIDGAIHDLSVYLENLSLPSNPLLSEPGAQSVLLQLYNIAQLSPVDGGQTDARVARLMKLGLLNVTLVNTSGSGKTKLLFEILAREWGFFYTCSWNKDTSPYGSTDIQFYMNPHRVVMRRLGDKKFDDIDPNLDPKAQDAQLGINVNIVDGIANIILLARLLIWTIFLDVYHEKRSEWQAEYDAAPQSVLPPEKRAKRAWVLFQAFPRLNQAGEIGNARDVFQALCEALFRLTPESCAHELQRVMNALEDRGYVPFFLVFDEVQKMASQLTNAFPDTLRNAKRPLLKPVVYGLSKFFENARIFVAGTRLYKSSIDDALLSSVLKAHGNKMFSDIGGYFRDDDIKTALYHFFTKKFVDSWPEDIIRDVLFWFRGRHRFLSVFIEWVLKVGPEGNGIRRVLDNVVRVASGADLHNKKGTPRDPSWLDIHLRSVIPRVFPKLRSKATFKKESYVTRIAREAIIDFICLGEIRQYGTEALELVEHGIGVFVTHDKSGVVQISERLVLASLMNYFTHPYNPVNIRQSAYFNLKKVPGGEGGAGTGFEMAMIYIFWEIFSDPGGAVLADVFNFGAQEPGRTRSAETNSLDLTPEWALCTARLVTGFPSLSSHGPEPRRVQRRLTSRLAKRVSDYQAVLDWFHDHSMGRGDDTGMPPFLCPSVHCGPDIFFVLELEHPTDKTASKHYILVSVSCKNWRFETRKDGKPTVKGRAEIRDAIFTMSPEGFFSKLGKDDGETRPRVRHELQSYLAHFPPLPGTELPPEPASDSQNPAKAPSNKKKDVAYPYSDKIEYGVLRCFACFPSTAHLPDRTTADGIYPLATLTEKAIKKGHYIGFDAFREALEKINSTPGLTEEQEVEQNPHTYTTDSQTTLESQPVDDDDSMDVDDATERVAIPSIRRTLEEYMTPARVKEVLASDALQSSAVQNPEDSTVLDYDSNEDEDNDDVDNSVENAENNNDTANSDDDDDDTGNHYNDEDNDETETEDDDGEPGTINDYHYNEEEQAKDDDYKDNGDDDDDDDAASEGSERMKIELQELCDEVDEHQAKFGRQLRRRRDDVHPKHAPGTPSYEALEADDWGMEVDG